MKKFLLLFLLLLPFSVDAGTVAGRIIRVSGSEGTINIGKNWGVKEGMKGVIFYVLEIGTMKKKIPVANFAVTSVGATKSTILIYGKKAPVNVGYRLQFNAKLQKAVYKPKPKDKGGIYINSKPQGATVYISGKNYGKKTPCLIENIPVGKYRIELKKDFYFGTAEAVIKKNQITKITIELKAEPGSIQFNSDPFEAKLYIDGEYKGKTPILIPKLKAGRHTVKLEKENYFPIEKTIYVKGGVKEELNFKLKPYGYIKLIIKPEDAEVLLDGEELKCEKGVCEKKVETGKHSILITREKYLKFSKEFTVNIGEKKVFNIKLKIYPSVKILSTPEKAYVYMEGNKLGRTPLKLDFPDEGEYKFTLKKDKYADKTVKIKLEAGKTKILNVKLIPLPVVQINTDPDEANVYLNERLMGKTPLKIILKKPGKYEFVIKKRYYKKKKIDLEIDYGDSPKFNIKLEFQKKYAKQMMRIMKIKKIRSTKKVLGWIFSSVGVVSIGASVPFGIWWYKNQSKADSEYDKYKSFEYGTKPEVFDEQIKVVHDYADKAKKNYTLAASFFGVGAAALAFGIYNFVTTPPEPSMELISITPYYDGHNAFLSIRGNF